MRLDAGAGLGTFGIEGAILDDLVAFWGWKLPTLRLQAEVGVVWSFTSLLICWCFSCLQQSAWAPLAVSITWFESSSVSQIQEWSPFWIEGKTPRLPPLRLTSTEQCKIADSQSVLRR